MAGKYDTINTEISKADFFVLEPIKQIFSRLTGSDTVSFPELSLNQVVILNFTAISLFMVMSSVAGIQSPVTVTETPTLEQQNVVKEISKNEVEKMMSTEQYVRQYFSDIPIMVQIAKCESHYRQLDDNGDIHRGVENNQDVGVMQINEHYHLDTAQKEKFDIYTLEGNTQYARELYEKFGTQPWSSSKACWGKYVNKDVAVNTAK